MPLKFLSSSFGFCAVDGAPSFEDVERNEIKRQLLRKLAYKKDIFSLLFRWDGTVLQLTLKDSVWWMSLFFYGLTKYSSTWFGTEHLESHTLAQYMLTAGGMLGFLVVFFTVECYTRFKLHYNEQKLMMNSIYDMAIIAASRLPREKGFQILRYFNCAHIMSYLALSRSYNGENLFWPVVNKHHLLTSREIEVFKDQMSEPTFKAHHAYREFLVWCLDLIKQAQIDGTIDMMERFRMDEVICKFRNSAQALVALQHVTIPYAYVNLITMLIHIYCPLLGVSLAMWQHTGVATSVAAIFFSNIFLVGLFGVGRIMQDPFSDDPEDLSSLGACNMTIENSIRVLYHATDIPNSSDAEEEDLLSKHRTATGIRELHRGNSTETEKQLQDKIDGHSKKSVNINKVAPGDMFSPSGGAGGDSAEEEDRRSPTEAPKLSV